MNCHTQDVRPIESHESNHSPSFCSVSEREQKPKQNKVVRVIEGHYQQETHLFLFFLTNKTC